jgi:ubiquinone/menaquinone biosynthesis C-methylase UbiE
MDHESLLEVNMSDVESLSKKYDRVSRFYDLLDLPFEVLRYDGIRREIWKGLSGKILDAGVGTGRNIPYYPSRSEVIGIDNSPGMLERARKRAGHFKQAATLLRADIGKLPFPDRHFDTVVATFLFCVLPEPQPGLKEIRRVCRPGGRFILLEYVLSKHPLRRAWMSFLSPYTKFLYGADFRQDSSSHLASSGFQIIEERFLAADILKLIVAQPR